MGPYLEERADIINGLLRELPYSRAWFEAQPTKVLYAMYSRIKRPKVNTPESPHNKVNIERKEQDGVNFIKTDSGEWEEEQD